MNTIAPAPAIRKLPPGKRVVGVLIGILGGTVVNVSLGYTAFSFWSRQTKFVPFDTTSPDLATPLFKSHNPSGNQPACIDHAVRTVPLSQLKTTDQKDLTRDFCRGVWGGIGYAFQRRVLEKMFRTLPGREDQIWDREDLKKAEYDVGTKITDHFEVVVNTPEKIIVRCGDSPLVAGHRPNDGLFSMEVTKDEQAQTATFHLKSVFVDTTPDGKDAPPQPWHLQWAHRQYTKLWMETAVRQLLN